MKIVPVAISGLAHLGVLLALYTAEPSELGRADGPELIVFEPVVRPSEPEPSAEPEPSEPEPIPELETPEPPPAEPEPPAVKPEPPAEAPPATTPVATAGPTNSEVSAELPPEDEAEEPSGPRKLGLTLSNVDGKGGKGSGKGSGAGKGTSGEAEAAADACSEAKTKPKPIDKVPIEYPTAARAAGLEGRLVLQAIVAPSGKVREVRVLESLGPEIDEPAQAAMKRWRFEPATHCGKAIEARYVIAREFRLGD